MKIILASTSPRRKELLEREGIDFIIDASSITEYLDSSLEIEERLKKLAYDKGISIHEKYPDDVVISADTIMERLSVKLTVLMKQEKFLNH